MRQRVRHVGGMCAVLLVVTALTACVPEPVPTPTATGFVSEAEAFAAAEATYRAYIDALNDVDLADPQTFEPVFELTEGAARSSISKELSEMHAEDWTVAGNTVVSEITAKAVNAEGAVELSVCADVSAVSLVDSSGTSMVAPDRPPVQPLTVMVSGTSGSTRVSSISGRTGGEPQC